jgi:muramoyltetrapeptide carboxypeptidase
MILGNRILSFARYHQFIEEEQAVKIAVVAPANMLSVDVPAKITALAQSRFGDKAPEIVFHSQCFLSSGHFAGPDKAREDALVEVANDPEVDAVWFARGGYGSNRIAERAIARMAPAAKTKPFLGYSDIGFILAGLLAKGIGEPVHAPMPADINRAGGDDAVARTLEWLILRGEPRLRYYFGELPYDAGGGKYAAFNLMVLCQLLGTPLQPDFSGRTLMLEEVDEALYAIDRCFFQVTSNPGARKAAGIMLGRCAPITPNNPDFGLDEEAIAKHWCAVSGIPYLGRADIGHDGANKVVPFG